MTPGHRRGMRDERGAILVIALFFAVFAVSILYLGVGAAESVLYREHLQDTADAAALSGAVTHARLMNVLVLINLVMAALVAVLLTLKLVEGLAIAGVSIAAGLAFFTGGSSLAAVPPLNALRSNMSGLYDAMKPDIFEILIVLHDVSDKTAEVAPSAAKAAADSEIERRRGDCVSEGFTAPTSLSLPVSDDSYARLCENAGTLVEKVAAKPFEGVPGIGAIVDELLSPVSDMAGAMADWFCGDDSGGANKAPPDLSQEISRGYPAPENAAACENEEIAGVARGEEPSVKSKACDETEAAKEKAQPDEQGRCREDCGADGPYEYAVKQARIDCEPTEERKPTKYRFHYQRLRVTYAWDGTKWVKGQPEVLEDEVVNSKRPPCGPKAVEPTVAVGYNRRVHPGTELSIVENVCSSETTPKLGEPTQEQKDDGSFSPEPVIVEYEQVPQIFGCMRKQRTKVAAHEDKQDGAEDGSVSSEDKRPKSVIAGVRLGEEAFQVRSMVFGHQRQRESERLVRLGLWGKSDPSHPLEQLRALGGFSVAQAEYYYAGTEGRDAWMWNMSWRARLRRFSVVGNDAGGSDEESSVETKDPTAAIGQGCVSQSDVKRCDRAITLLERFKDATLH